MLYNAQASWKTLHKDERAACLNRAADLMEAQLQSLMVLLSRESGKTYCQCYC